MIKIKRIYEAYDKSDGYRVLIDRLWPRGVSKEDAHVDLWLKDIAPSTELREQFGHEVEKWPAFQKAYTEELRGHKDLIELIKKLEKTHTTLTILFGAKDTEHNNAVVLTHFLADGKRVFF